MRISVSRVASAVTLLVATTLLAPLPAATASNQGLNGGWVVGDSGAVSFPPSLPSQLPIMQEAGAGWVRINFRLGDCYRNWTDPITAADVTRRGCDPLLQGHTALQDIEEAGESYGLVGNDYRAGDTSAANLALRKPAFAASQQYARWPRADLARPPTGSRRRLQVDRQ